MFNLKLSLLGILLLALTACPSAPVRTTPPKDIKYIPCRDVSPIWTHELDTERTKVQVDEFNLAYDAACDATN